MDFTKDHWGRGPASSFFSQPAAFFWRSVAEPSRLRDWQERPSSENFAVFYDFSFFKRLFPIFSHSQSSSNSPGIPAPLHDHSAAPEGRAARRSLMPPTGDAGVPGAAPRADRQWEWNQSPGGSGWWDDVFLAVIMCLPVCVLVKKGVVRI